MGQRVMIMELISVLVRNMFAMYRTSNFSYKNILLTIHKHTLILQTTDTGIQKKWVYSQQSKVQVASSYRIFYLGFKRNRLSFKVKLIERKGPNGSGLIISIKVMEKVRIIMGSEELYFGWFNHDLIIIDCMA